MTNPEETVKSDKQHTEHILTSDHALEAWKHFETAGGADKTTMVTVESLFLTFSGTIIGYIGTNLLKPDSFAFSKPVAALFLATVGVVISIAAGFVAFIYGGYASNNWARGDKIATARGWHELLHSGSNALEHSKSIGLAARFVRREDCATSLAWIFIIFMIFAILSAVIHSTILVWSILHVSSSSCNGGLAFVR